MDVFCFHGHFIFKKWLLCYLKKKRKFQTVYTILTNRRFSKEPFLPEDKLPRLPEPLGQLCRYLVDVQTGDIDCSYRPRWTQHRYKRFPWLGPLPQQCQSTEGRETAVTNGLSMSYYPNSKTRLIDFQIPLSNKNPVLVLEEKLLIGLHLHR